jgi:hypothetical protein
MWWTFKSEKLNALQILRARSAVRRPLNRVLLVALVKLLWDAEAQRNLSQQMGDIQAQGSQAAYDRAAQMFTSDQARQLAAQQANQQAGITTGGQNLSANLATQQLGTQTGTTRRTG